MAVFYSRARHGYAVEFSPYFGNRLAYASSQHYGIAGKGTSFVFDVTPQGIQPVVRYEWPDGLFDCTWSETNDSIFVTSSGDGSLQMWDVKLPQGPVQVFKEHSSEVYSVDWSTVRGSSMILSGSWDNTIKMWDPGSPQSSLATFPTSGNIYSAIWSPHIPNTFASASGDGMLSVWDTSSSSGPVHAIKAHNVEVLTCDWSKYDQNILVSGSADSSIRIWDLRNTNRPFGILMGHSYAVRRVKCSPHQASVLASCSYDFTVQFWDFACGSSALEVIEHHTEFVLGLDFNLHVPGQIADCSWDEKICVFTPQCLPSNPPGITR